MPDSQYDFAGRDYAATLERLMTILRSEVPELTDLNHSDAGISILRLVARDSDQLAFYLDEAFAEGYINTARYKQSLVDLAKLVGYPPKLAAAASTTLTLTRKDGVTGDISISKWSSFSRTDGKTYVTLAAYTMLAASDTIDVEVFEGVHVQDTVSPGEWVQPDLSGLWKYNLGAGVAYGSVTLEHGAGPIVWTEQESLWRTFETDYHFLLEFYADLYGGSTDTVFLVLGGYGKPSEDATVDYLQCTGASGNTGYGTIVTVDDSPLKDKVTCAHTDPATGGAAAETTENLRQRIPWVTRTQRRAVTTEDYEAVIESISGVKHCQAIDRRYGSEWPHEYVVLFVVPEGGGPMSAGLKTSIWAELADKGHRGDWENRYLLYDPTEVEVDVTATIGIAAGYSPSAVISSVTTAIQALLSPDGIEIAEDLQLSALYEAVMDVAGVTYVNFTSPSDTVTADNGEILVDGTITITQGS